MRNLHRGQQNPRCPARPGTGGSSSLPLEARGRLPSRTLPLCNTVNLPRAVPPPTGQGSAPSTRSRACLSPGSVASFPSGALTCRAESSVPAQQSFAQTSPVFCQAPGSCPSLMAGKAQPHGKASGRSASTSQAAGPFRRGEDRLFGAGGLHQPGLGGHHVLGPISLPCGPELQAGRSNPAFSQPNCPPAPPARAMSKRTLLLLCLL